MTEESHKLPLTRFALFKYDSAMRIIRTLREAGFEALLAGGCVRDLLLRRRPKDYDVVTSARPDQIKELFDNTIAVGERFGVVKVVLQRQQVEVATFRTDGAYLDGRRPEEVQYGGREEDARRRDFTVNGMFYDPMGGRVIDHVGGLDDLKNGLVRTVGDPQERFGEDYLRMLRGVRFSAALGFRIEDETLAAIRANAAKIGETSGERVRQELEAMLVDESRRRAFQLLDETGLLAEVLPEVAAMKGVKQSKSEHPEGDVWQHTLLALEYLEEPSFVLAMGVLLHDVGKPATVKSGGERPFLQHERVGDEMARAIAARLRLSRRETEQTAFLVHYHMLLKDVGRMKKGKLKQLIAHEMFAELAEVHRVDALASNGDLSNYEKAMQASMEFSTEEVQPAPLASGHDLAAIGIKPGPKMGRILRALYEAQLEEEILTKNEALRLAERLASEEARG